MIAEYDNNNFSYLYIICSLLQVLSLLVAGVVCNPEPGRIPKVYNALITSNQNLEPSKAYPVYQPVLHETLTFPFQPTIFYSGDFALSNVSFPFYYLLNT